MELGWLESSLVRVFDTAGVTSVAVLVACAVGAAHAVAPGHGKAITAAYLVSDRARRRDAVLLGASVSAMHTLSVAVLAVVWVSLSTVATVATDRITAWLQVVAAVLVVGVGALLVARRLGHEPHGHHHHDHHHPDHHHHDHHHHDHQDLDELLPAGGVATAPARAQGVSRRLLGVIAVSGGLLPSPSAFLVLVTGMLSGRAGVAWLLVVAFAVGLAATLTVVGLATVAGRDALVERASASVRLRAVQRWTPLLGAVGVVVAGLVYLLVALAGIQR